MLPPDPDGCRILFFTRSKKDAIHGEDGRVNLFNFEKYSAYIGSRTRVSAVRTLRPVLWGVATSQRDVAGHFVLNSSSSLIGCLASGRHNS
jgi:hypothetical protein